MKRERLKLFRNARDVVVSPPTPPNFQTSCLGLYPVTPFLVFVLVIFIHRYISLNGIFLLTNLKKSSHMITIQIVYSVFELLVSYLFLKQTGDSFIMVVSVFILLRLWRTLGTIDLFLDLLLYLIKRSTIITKSRFN